MNLRYAALRRDLSRSCTSILRCCAICFFSFVISALASSSGEQKSAALRGVSGFMWFFLDWLAPWTRLPDSTGGAGRTSNCGKGLLWVVDGALWLCGRCELVTTFATR